MFNSRAKKETLLKRSSRTKSTSSSDLGLDGKPLKKNKPVEATVKQGPT